MEINCVVKIVYEVYSSIASRNSAGHIDMWVDKYLKTFETEEEAQKYKKEIDDLNIVDKVYIMRKWNNINVFDKELSPENAYDEINKKIK